MKRTRWMFAMLLCALPLFGANQVPLQTVPIHTCEDCDALWADFNGDGLDDVLHQNQLQFNLGGRLAPSIVVDAINENGSDYGGDRLSFAGDFNRDGFADVIVNDGNQNRLMLGDGTGQFPTVLSLPESRGRTIQVADFTGDGRLDLLVPDTASRQLLIYRGLGDATFRLDQELEWPSRTLMVLHSDPVAISDLDGDGRADLILASPNHIAFFFAQADGKFVRDERYTRDDVFGIQAGDVNGDGKRDLVFVMGNHPEVRLVALFGDGTGRFPETAEVSIKDAIVNGHHVDTDPQSMLVGDFVPGGADEIAVSEPQGDVVVYGVQNGRMNEVARASLDVYLPLLKTARFRSFKPELLVTGTILNPRHDEAWSIDALGEIAAPAKHPSRGRAVGRALNFADGTYELSVQSDCPVPGFNSFTFDRDGLFVNFATSSVIQKAEAAYLDGAIDATFTIRDGDRLRVLSGALEPTADGRLTGKLIESGTTPCGKWQIHHVTAVSH